MKISEIRWNITKPPSTVLTELSEINGEPVESDGRYHWKNQESLFLRRELWFDEGSGSIVLENHVPDYYRLTLISVFLAGLIAAFTGSSTLVQAATVLSTAITIRVLLFVSMNWRSEHDLVSCSVGWEFYFSVVTSACLMILYPGVDTLSRSLVVIGAALIFIFHYVRGMLPVGSRDGPVAEGSYAHLRIPFLTCIWVGASILLLQFSVFLRVSGVPFQVNLVVTAVASVVGVYGVCVYCSDSLTALLHERTAPFDSELGRVAVFAAYLVVSAASLTGVALGIELVYFGVFREGLLSNLPSDYFLYEIFRESDQTFRSFPLLPARVYSASVNGLAFLPVFSVFAMWVVNLSHSVIQRVRIWFVSEDLGVSYDWLPEDVEVVRSDIGGVHPFYSVLTGRRLIVVGEEVVERLEPRELEAVIAHEHHHFVNRDLRYHWLASVLSIVLIGGKSSLLAFYDRVQAELDADDYAVETVGKMPFITAVRKLENFSSDEVDFQVALGGRSNGFGILRERVRDWMLIRHNRASDWVFRKFVFPVIATYYLFFGGALFDAAHLSGDERIERV